MAADTECLASRVDAVEAALVARLRDEARASGVVFLYVGQLIKRKGLACLLDAWSSFENQNPQAGTLMLVGGGPEEPLLRAQAQKLGLRKVHFAGAIDYDHLAPYYAAADAFVIPTLEDNWSLVVPEAMACGLPILCSKYNGCWPELVQEERNGWVFDPAVRQSTLACLHRAVQAPTKLKQMGLRSREIIQQHSPACAARAIFATCLLASGNIPATLEPPPEKAHVPITQRHEPARPSIL